MRVTVCELPHEPIALRAAWQALCEHTRTHGSELVLLPECAMVEPVWEHERFDRARWAAAESLSDAWLERLHELRATFVVGARPRSVQGRRFNQGFIWSAACGLSALRRKYYLPQQTGGWEANWFERGDEVFPAFRAGALSFGLNICTELWALETYATYAAAGVHAIFSPRATAAATTAKWMAVGVVAAVRSGAYGVSSNRVDPTGTCGGEGWIISPDGEILARTSRASPFATIELDLAASAAAREGYPCNVWRDECE